MQLSPFPAFAVSHSSTRRLLKCPREHYWAVYGSWRGWDDMLPAEDPRRLAWTLKQGKGLAGLVGDLVHDLARTAFDAVKAGIPLNLHQYRTNARAAYSVAVRMTLDGRGYRADPKKNPPVLEVYYAELGWEERVRRYHEELDAAIDALFVNEHFLAVLEGRAEVLYCEDRFQLEVDVPRLPGDVVEPGGVGEGAPAWKVIAWVIPDLVYTLPATPNQRVIVDWKTGRLEDGARAQVGVYTAWLAQQDGIPPEDIAAVAVYLPHYVERAVEGSRELVETAMQELRDGARRALAYVAGSNPARNEPKAIEEFPMLPEGSKECRYCAFRRLCGRG